MGAEKPPQAPELIAEKGVVRGIDEAQRHHPRALVDGGGGDLLGGKVGAEIEDAPAHGGRRGGGEEGAELVPLTGGRGGEEHRRERRDIAADEHRTGRTSRGRNAV
jgi:hypothetical protein